MNESKDICNLKYIIFEHTMLKTVAHYVDILQLRLTLFDLGL